MSISVIILTYNSEATLGKTLTAASKISDDLHVVDSYSTDSTQTICSKFGAKFVQRAFKNYAEQRNWAIDNLPFKYDWELHLDADEQLSEELIAEILDLKSNGMSAKFSGYHVARLIRFLGREIRHGGMFPIWHMRLFSRGSGRCEDREYDQHFIVNGQTAHLYGPMIDDICIPLSEWINRHNRWSDGEMRDLLRKDPVMFTIQAKLFGSPIERKRFYKSLYNRLPFLMRAYILFLYRYCFRLGFLDGQEGAIFFGLQTFWYRFLVDAKLFEANRVGDSARAARVQEFDLSPIGLHPGETKQLPTTDHSAREDR
jgi:glycosyltransferase involved in cell wall biosynthesis